jgi:hypothetical protein
MISHLISPNENLAHSLKSAAMNKEIDIRTISKHHIIVIMEISMYMLVARVIAGDAQSVNMNGKL